MARLDGDKPCYGLALGTARVYPHRQHFGPPLPVSRCPGGVSKTRSSWGVCQLTLSQFTNVFNLYESKGQYRLGPRTAFLKHANRKLTSHPKTHLKVISPAPASSLALVVHGERKRRNSMEENKNIMKTKPADPTADQPNDGETDIDTAINDKCAEIRALLPEPARTASPSTSEQIAAAALNRRIAELEINSILLQLKNGKVCRRVLQQALKGTTYNDAELVPVILWCMFGRVQKGATLELVPAHRPDFPYQGNCREMSLRSLAAILKARYKQSLSYKQLRRIFAGLKRLKLLTNLRVPSQDKVSGKWTSRSSYFFQTNHWLEVLQLAKTTPKVMRGKKRTPKPSGLDQMVGPQHRVKVVSGAAAKPVAEPLVFCDKPSAQASPVFSLKGGGQQGLPGEVIELGAGVVAEGGPLLEASPAQQQKGPAAPAARIEQARKDNATFREAPAGYFSTLSEEDQADWNKLEPWEYLLTKTLDDKSKDGPGWRTTLYEDEGALTLKPRIPDCVVIEADQDYQLRGVWSIDRPAFIHLGPADLAIGDFVKRLTGCPLRFKDWEQAIRLTRLPVGDPCRLTLDNLILFAQAARNGVTSDSWSTVDNDGSPGMSYNVGTVIPELFAFDLAPYSNAMDLDDSDDDMFKEVLPFLYADRVKPKSLLSPDNAGKLLFNWATLWPAFCRRFDNKPRQSLAQLPAFQGPNPYTAFENLAELDRAVSFSRGVVRLLDDCYGVSNELTSLCHIQNFPGGVSALSQSTRATLHYVMLRLYTKAPQIWLDLERWMGAEVFAAAMPVKDLDRCRSFATAILRSRLEQLPQDYLSMKPTQFFS